MARQYDLRPENYSAIENAMLIPDPALPSALDDMTKRLLCLPHYHNRILPLYRYDTSFTRQMQDAYNTPEYRPDVVIGTAYSGIPPLDAVRGYYEEIGEDTPLFASLRVGQWFSAQYHSKTPLMFWAEVKAIAMAAQLRPIVAGAKVTIIEEYVRSGSSIEICGRIAREAGAAAVVGIRGSWYDNVQGRIDTFNMTSRHATFMRGIGRRAASIQRPDTEKTS